MIEFVPRQPSRNSRPQAFRAQSVCCQPYRFHHSLFLFTVPAWPARSTRTLGTLPGQQSDRVFPMMPADSAELIKYLALVSPSRMSIPFEYACQILQPRFMSHNSCPPWVTSIMAHNPFPAFSDFILSVTSNVAQFGREYPRLVACRQANYATVKEECPLG